MFQHAIVVKLSQVFNLGDPALVESEIILLESEADRLDQRVDDADHEFAMVPIQRAEENGEEVDIAVLDLSWFGEDLVKNRDYLRYG